MSQSGLNQILSLNPNATVFDAQGNKVQLTQSLIDGVSSNPFGPRTVPIPNLDPTGTLSGLGQAGLNNAALASGQLRGMDLTSALSNRNFFDNIASGTGLNGDNQIFQNAVGTIFSGGSGGGNSSFNAFSGGGNFGSQALNPEDFANLTFGNKIISQDNINAANDFFLNAPSLLDSVGGSNPFVDRINELTEQNSNAFLARQNAELDERVQRNLQEQLVGNGILSGSAIANSTGDIINEATRDFAAFDATQQLENTRFLGELALQDAELQTRQNEFVLTQALVDKGFDESFARAMAAEEGARQRALVQANVQQSINAQNQQTALRQAQIQSATQLLLGGQEGFFNTVDNQIDAANLPLTGSIGVAGALPAQQESKSKSKSKSI